MSHPEYTLATLSTHNTVSDLWIAVHGKVYDLSRFAADHPGGIDVLLDSAGTDGTEVYDYAGHSDSAMQTMQQFLVGRVEGYRPTTSSSSTEKPSTTAAARGGRVTLKPVVVGAVIVAGVVVSARGMGMGAKILDGLGQWNAFGGGVVVAGGISAVGWMWLYRLFAETLVHEKEVFHYPPVIARRK